MTDSAQCVDRGDITITQTHKGHMVARSSVAPDGPGPWWHSIAVIATFEDAACFARTIAERDGVRAWIRKGEEQFELLRDQECIPPQT
jgi:hypothetical protein